MKLQKEQQKEQQKNHAQQEKIIKNMQSSYEQRITELTGSLNCAIAETVLPNPTAGDVSEKSYDLFISHAWEDKESFADELDEKLSKLGLKVWYDTNEIKLGYSMRKRIDEGLRKSRYSIVVFRRIILRKESIGRRRNLMGSSSWKAVAANESCLFGII